MALLRFCYLSHIVSCPFPSEFSQPSYRDPSWALPRAVLTGHPDLSFPAIGLSTAFSLKTFNRLYHLSEAVMAA